MVNDMYGQNGQIKKVLLGYSGEDIALYVKPDDCQVKDCKHEGCLKEITLCSKKEVSKKLGEQDAVCWKRHNAPPSRGLSLLCGTACIVSIIALIISVGAANRF
jgi:hypothetical protein